MRRFFERKARERSSSRGSESSTNDSNTAVIQEETVLEAPRHLPLGIKALHEPTTVSVDILFIHGLTGDREKTWSTAQGSIWPATLLPPKLPTARVLTFGYDAYVVDLEGLVSKNRIANHAMDLLSALATYREKDGTNRRPIIYVCHSFGGLVCQNALVHARQRPEQHFRQLYECTRGILFLGTPHRGAGLARWGEMLACTLNLIKPTDSRTLDVMNRDFEVLERVQDSFFTIIRSRVQDNLPPIEITCFFENSHLPGIGLVVPRESAALPGYNSISIHQNHMNMTKFADEEDPDFVALVGELRRCVNSLAKSVIPNQLAVLSPSELSGRASGVFFRQSEYVDPRVTDIKGDKDELAKWNFRPQDEEGESRFNFRVDRDDFRYKREVHLQDLVHRVTARSDSAEEHPKHSKCVALTLNGRRCAKKLPSSDYALAAKLLQIIITISDEVISLDLLQAYISNNLCRGTHRNEIFLRDILLTGFAQQLQNEIRQEIALDRKFAVSTLLPQGNDLRVRFDNILHDFPKEGGQAVALALKVLLGLSGKDMLSLRFVQDFLQFMVNHDIIRENTSLDQSLLQLSALRLLPGVIEIKGDSRDPANCQIYYNHPQLRDLMTSSWWFQNTWPALFTEAYQETHWERLCNEQLATFEGRKARSVQPALSMSDEGYISHGPATDIQERAFLLASDSGFQDHGSSSYGTRSSYRYGETNEVDLRSEEDSGLSSAVNRVTRSDEEIGSRRGYDRNPMILAAEKHLQACFAADEQLTSLLRQVSTSIAERYLEADIRELLKYHHLDLKKLASTNLEHAAANLLRSHWYRQRIAVALVDLLNGRNPETDGADGERPDEKNGAEGSAYHLNRWLQDNPGFNALPRPPPSHHNAYDIASTDLAHDEEAQEELERNSDTDGELDDNDVEAFAADDYVKRMECFIFGGLPFRKLLERVQTYAINREHTNLRCTLMTLPNRNINFNFGSNANWFDQLRSSFERHCTMKCNWWPLAPPSLPTRHNHCRVSWICHCGSGHYEDVPEQDARKLQQLIRLRCLPLSEDHLCLRRKRLRRGWSHFWPILVDNISTALFAKWQTVISVPTRQQSDGQATTPSPSISIHSTASNPVSTSAPTQQSPLMTMPRSGPTSTTPSVGNQQSTNTVSMPRGDRSLILLGVKVKRWTIKIEQIDIRVRGPRNDGDVIDRLLSSYRTARGSLRLWLSVNQLETLHFRQFFKHRQNRVNAGSEGIPESNLDYEYRIGEQSPPDTRRPPIRPDEFRDYLSSCATPCFYWIFPWHECNLPSQETRLLDSIPKKKSFWTLDCAGVDEAWGLDCIYDLCMIRVLGYHILMLCGTFGFWIWWQAQHPDDLQTAAVPVTVVLSLISAFWSTTGVLKQASDKIT